MADDPLPPLLEAVLSVGTDLELRTTLQHIVDAAADLTGARYAALGTADPGQDGLIELLPQTSSGGPHLASLAGPGPARTAVSLTVSIRVQDEEFGTLHLADKGKEPFTAEDEQPLHVLAAQAGIAIGNARLYEAARQRERWIEGAAAVTTALLGEGVRGRRAHDGRRTRPPARRGLRGRHPPAHRGGRHGDRDRLDVRRSRRHRRHDRPRQSGAGATPRR
ncbi:GAF domain-containing protein [Streptomyces canus]|nr:GAF domain-containing protein [Streptomyces canus]